MNYNKYLVFDIETAPIDWEGLSKSQQEYLLRGAVTEEDIQKRKFEMGLTPFTAQVVCIGLQLMSRKEDGSWELIKRAALSTHPKYNNPPTSGDEALPRHEEIELPSGSPCYVSSEAKILEDFWNILKKYDYPCLISFNGRNFDAPFLMLRSALHRIKPSKNLMDGTKFNYSKHVDLIDELTFYSPGPYGATRRFNFDYYTRAFGITSPKSEGVDGSMVGELYNKGEIIDIADYCLRDVSATWELFIVWSEYLAFK